MNASTPTLPFADRLRSLLVDRRPPMPLRYLGAVAGVAATAVAQLYLFGGSAPWFLYTPAVVLITLGWGGGTGILATALAALAAGYVVVQASLLGSACLQRIRPWPTTAP